MRHEQIIRQLAPRIANVEIHKLLVGRRLRAREVREIEVLVCISEIEMTIAGRDGDVSIDVIQLRGGKQEGEQSGNEDVVSDVVDAHDGFDAIVQRVLRLDA